MKDAAVTGALSALLGLVLALSMTCERHVRRQLTHAHVLGEESCAERFHRRGVFDRITSPHDKGAKLTIVSEREFACQNEMQRYVQRLSVTCLRLFNAYEECYIEAVRTHGRREAEGECDARRVELVSGGCAAPSHSH